MRAFYNEIDPFCAAWLRNLIEAGEIPAGVVDERSIEDIAPNELAGFAQCHFFAGIGGWPLALRQAGVPADRPLWTGSCPCQPFSAAGKGKGFADERHLWPAFDWLIGQCRPDLILGEQVEGSAGRAWLDLVATDLEGHGYAFGTAVFPAAGVGAPQIRHRTYWVADAMRAGRAERGAVARDRSLAGGCGDGRLADANSGGRERRRCGMESDGREAPRLEPERLRDAGGVADAHDTRSQGRPGMHERTVERAVGAGGVVGRLADADGCDRQEVSQGDDALDQQRTQIRWRQLKPAGVGANGGTGGGDRRAGGGGVRPAENMAGMAWPGAPDSFWSDADWIFCRDDKWRPVEPGTFPLAHGAASRVGRLRAYGNAICVPQAQAFIEAAL